MSEVLQKEDDLEMEGEDGCEDEKWQHGEIDRERPNTATHSNSPNPVLALLCRSRNLNSRKFLLSFNIFSTPR